MAQKQKVYHLTIPFKVDDITIKKKKIIESVLKQYTMLRAFLMKKFRDCPEQFINDFRKAKRKSGEAGLKKKIEKLKQLGTIASKPKISKRLIKKSSLIRLSDGKTKRITRKFAVEKIGNTIVRSGKYKLDKTTASYFKNIPYVRKFFDSLNRLSEIHFVCAMAALWTKPLSDSRAFLSKSTPLGSPRDPRVAITLNFTTHSGVSW